MKAISFLVLTPNNLKKIELKANVDLDISFDWDSEALTPYRSIGKHLDITNLSTTSIGGGEPNFPSIALVDL